jgi:multidrug efflux system membrane fusion protein
VVPTSAVQRGPAGTFSYVIGPDNVATAKPVVVTQQNENDAVIASGLTASDRVVTTGFANLSDGAKVLIGENNQAPTADLAPRAKRSRAPDANKGGQKDGQAKDGVKDGADGQKKDWQGKDGEHRGKRGEGDQKGAAPSGNDQSGGAAKSRP